MKPLEENHFTDENAFRNWLEMNHDKSPGIWMIFYKKHTGIKCIGYDEALDTALCYGWIDSIIKRIDTDKYARKFTPRTDTAKWSEVNMKKVDQLYAKGKMTRHGLLKIESYAKTGAIDWTGIVTSDNNYRNISPPEFFLKALSENEPALTNFNNMVPTYQRPFILWISTAKKEETRKKRLIEAVALLKTNQKLGLK